MCFNASLFLYFPALAVLSEVAVLLKNDYFVRGAGLPGRFKAEKMEFHWGQNGSAGSEHSIAGRRFPVEVRAYLVPQQGTKRKKRKKNSQPRIYIETPALT